MDSAKLAQAVEAIGSLAEDAGGSLPKKPNVADVEALTGFDMTAPDRDEAWAAYQAAQEGAVAAEADEGDTDAPKPAATPDKPAGTTRVTNRYTGPISPVPGVTIAPGQTAEVRGFDPEHGVIALWIDKGVLEVA